MEMEQFNAFNRRLTNAGASRRAMLRRFGAGLLGAAVVGVAARASRRAAKAKSLK